jgi:hypothetical protein
VLGAGHSFSHSGASSEWPVFLVWGRVHFGWLRSQEHHLSWSFWMSLKVYIFLASGQRCCVVHIFAVVWLAVSWVSRCVGGVVGVLAISMPREASSEWCGLLWNSAVLVSSSMAPLRHELQVVEAAEAGFEMAVLQKKISCFSRLRTESGMRRGCSSEPLQCSSVNLRRPKVALCQA